MNNNIDDDCGHSWSRWFSFSWTKKYPEIRKQVPYNKRFRFCHKCFGMEFKEWWKFWK